MGWLARWLGGGLGGALVQLLRDLYAGWQRDNAIRTVAADKVTIDALQHDAGLTQHAQAAADAARAAAVRQPGGLRDDDGFRAD